MICRFLEHVILIRDRHYRSVGFHRTIKLPSGSAAFRETVDVIEE